MVLSRQSALLGVVELVVKDERDNRHARGGVGKCAVIPARTLAEPSAQRVGSERWHHNQLRIRDALLRQELSGGLRWPAGGALNEIVGGRVDRPAALQAFAKLRHDHLDAARGQGL